MSDVKPVGLFSTPGLFGFATATGCKRISVKKTLQLFDFVKATGKPFVKNRRKYFFAIREITMEATDGETGTTTRTKQLLIGAKTLAEASGAFDKVAIRWNRPVEQKQPLTQILPARKDAALWDSIRLHMAKGYPKTIKAMHAAEIAEATEEKRKLTEEVFWAYVEETEKVFGHVAAKIPCKDLVERIARNQRAKRKHKRKRPYFDPIDFHLILGCQWKGYAAMSWTAMLANVKSACSISVLEMNALRQRWKRLGLPSERRRGRKRK